MTAEMPSEPPRSPRPAAREDPRPDREPEPPATPRPPASWPSRSGIGRGPDSDAGSDPAPLSVRRARGGAGMVRLFERLTRLQTRHPFLVLGVAVATVVVSLLLAMRLGFKSSFGELLPANKESVIIADKVAARLSTTSTLTMVAHGSDNQGLQRFVAALVPELRKLPPELVGQVDDGVKDTRKFFDEHRFLYAPLDLLHEIHDEVKNRYDYEVNKAAGFLLDEDEEPPAISEESIRKKIDDRQRKAEVSASGGPTYPGGYYLDEQKHIIAVLIRTPVSSGDLERSEALKGAVREVVARVDPHRYDPAAEIGYTGNLLTSAEEYHRVTSDLAHVGAWGVGLILGVVFLFYLRMRTLVAMTLTVGIGTAWTFGLAYLLIGYLNTSTGFLVSIVVGNGINFGIIYMARYLEARRDHTAERSLFLAHRETWLSTLTAAAAATAAYGSLVITAFRGFKHFGVIGGSGMLLCWLATYLFLPSILVVAEKLSPVRSTAQMASEAPAWRRRLGGLVPRPIAAAAAAVDRGLGKLRGAYGRPFARLVDRAPRVITVIGLVITIVAGVLAYRFLVRGDPMEYDMDNIANAPDVAPGEQPKSAVRRLGREVDLIVGRQGQDGIAIMTDRIDQVLPLKAELEKRRDAAPADRKPSRTWSRSSTCCRATSRRRSRW